MQGESVENIFARAWSLLTKNPVIIVPGLVVGLIVGISEALIVPHPQIVDASGNTDVVAAAVGVAGAFAAVAISVVVGVLAFLITETYTTGMAGVFFRSTSCRRSCSITMPPFRRSSCRRRSP